MLITHLLNWDDPLRRIPFDAFFFPISWFIKRTPRKHQQLPETNSEFTAENRPSHPSNRRSSSNRAPFLAEGYVSRCSFKREGLQKNQRYSPKNAYIPRKLLIGKWNIIYHPFGNGPKNSGSFQKSFLFGFGITVGFSLKLICPVLLDRWPIIGITILCHHRVNHQLFSDGTLQRLPWKTWRFGWTFGWNTPKQTVRF